MGVVYEAYHDGLGRTVALKVLSNGLSSNPIALKRFQLEGRAAAKLHHTNIVPLFEHGVFNEQPFLAMQIIRGVSLNDIILQLRETDSSVGDITTAECGISRTKVLGEDDQTTANGFLANTLGSGNFLKALNRSGDILVRGFDPFHQCAAIIVQVCDAIQYAHDRGVLHRDVKPSNVICDNDGVAWITDFGLAKSVGEDDGVTEGLTQTGDFVGTVRYMSPERFDGECDKSADIYAIGISLYELITLRHAYDGRSAVEVMRQIQEIDPTEPRKIDSKIPLDLETICTKAISKDPSHRYQSAGEMANDLRAFLSDRPISARRATLFEQFARWSRRNKSLAYSLIGIASLVAVLLVGSIVFSIRESGLRTAAELSEKDAKAKKKLADSESERAQQAERKANEKSKEVARNLYFAEMKRGGQTIGQPGSTAKLQGILEKQKRSANELDLIGWEYFYLKSWTKEDHQEIDFDNDYPTSMSFSPDEKKIAVGLSNYKIHVLDFSSGELQQTIELEHSGENYPADQLAWHPKKNWIAAAGKDLVIFDSDTGKKIKELYTRDSYSPCFSLGWSDDGNKLAFCLADQGFYYFDFEAKEDKLREIALENQELEPEWLSWSPDGKRLACGQWWRDLVEIFDVESRESVRDIKADYVVWAEDGHEVSSWFLASSTGKIKWIDAKTGSQKLILTGHKLDPNHLHCANEKFLISGGHDKTAKVWDLESGNTIRNFYSHNTNLSKVLLTSDGKRAFSCASGEPLRMWNVDRREKLFLPNKLDVENKDKLLIQHRVTDLMWHPKHEFLASTSYDGFGRLWSMELKEPRAYVQIVPSTHVDFASDGNQMLFSSQTATLLFGERKTRKLPVSIISKFNNDNSKICLLNELRATVYSDRGENKLYSLSGRAFDWHPKFSNQIYITYGNSLKLYDSEDIVEEADLEFEPSKITISPDAKWACFTVGEQDAAMVLNLESREVVKLVGHHNTVNAADWSPDSSRLATVADDGYLRIWETKTWNEVLSLEHGATSVHSVAWDADGKRIATGDQDGTIIVWDASSGYE